MLGSASGDGGSGAVGGGEDGVDDVIQCSADGPDHVSIRPLAVFEGGSCSSPTQFIQDLGGSWGEPIAGQEGEDVQWD